jgi:hypothetical protein
MKPSDYTKQQLYTKLLHCIPVLYVPEIVSGRATIAETVLRVRSTVLSCVFIFTEVN